VVIDKTRVCTYYEHRLVRSLTSGSSPTHEDSR